MIKEIHIFDFDGTLVDSSHRYKTLENGKIDLQYWIDNQDKTLYDSLLPLTDRFREIVNNPESFAVIATARIWCNLSVMFAYAANLIPNGLVARRDRNDCRGGAQLKITYVNRLLNLKQFKSVKRIVVYEDNITYLKTISDYFYQKGIEVIGHYHPSEQGH